MNELLLQLMGLWTAQRQPKWHAAGREVLLTHLQGSGALLRTACAATSTRPSTKSPDAVRAFGTLYNADWLFAENGYRNSAAARASWNQSNLKLVA